MESKEHEGRKPGVIKINGRNFRKLKARSRAVEVIGVDRREAARQDPNLDIREHYGYLYERFGIEGFGLG